MRQSPFLVVGSLCGLVACAATAQEVRPSDSGLTIKASVNEVLLDLVVRDKHGKLVKNLKPGDVEIYEDGVRQPVRGFRLVSGPEAAPPQEAAAPAAKPQSASIQSGSASGPLHTLHLICIVFQNLDPNTRKYAVEAVQQFLKEDLPPGTWVAIFNLDSNLTVLHNFTANRDELLRAAANASTGATLTFVGVAQAILSAQPNLVTQTSSGTPGPGGNYSETVDLKGGDLNPYAINDASVSMDIGASLQRGELVQQRRVFGEIEGMRQTDQIIMMIDQLGKLPGRKTVLLMSPGLTTTGDADRFESILNKANHSDVTVYAVDVNGLTQNANTQASTAATRRVAYLSQKQAQLNQGGSDAMMEQMRQDDYLHSAVRTSDTQATLRALSEGTGGFLIANTNDLRKPFTHLLEDMDTHYEVVYDPVSDKYDGHFRRITYKLARTDLTVESRAGYFAMPVLGNSPSLAPFEVTGLMVLDAKPRPQAFQFHSAAFQFRPDSTASQYGVVFEMPAANLTATAEPEQKKHRLHASVLALVKDANGQIVDKFSQDSNWEIPDDKLAAVQAQPITWTHPFNLPAGHYTVETVVLDREGNRAGTSVLEFKNPERKGIGLSSVMLVREVEPVKGQADAADPFEFAANRIVPELAPAPNSAGAPYVYFVVYPDKAKKEKPQIEVQFLVDGIVVARQTSDLPAADASGAIPMVVGAARKPGQCELKIAALQGGELAEQSVKYTVAAK